MKAQSSALGMNKTGLGTSPIDAKEVIEGATLGGPIPPGDEHCLIEAEMSYLTDGAGPVGSVPVPTTLKGAVKATVERIKGHAPAVFLDKLGERLAFERTGTRLYEGILTKFNACASWDGGPTRAELERFHDEELAHFLTLKEVIEELGGDPTAETPAADVQGVASMGLLQVISDPRTTLRQSLEALLTAELTDNDAWQMLIDLARELGKEEHVQRFSLAKAQEENHVAQVRRWISQAVSLEAKRDLAA